MRRARRTKRALATLLAGAWLPAAAAFAADEATGAAAADAAPAATQPAPEEPLDPDAVAALRRMVQALYDAKALRVRVDEEYDAIQDDGETLSFGKTAVLTLRRPDRLRVELDDRDGTRRLTSFDGQRVTFWGSERNAFASLDRSGDVDSTIAFLRDEVGLKMPIAPIFSTQLHELLLEHVRRASWIEVSRLDGVDCDHVAFDYGDDVGVQFWIPRQGMALPRRVVMTFETARGRPQFRADFREWELSPDVSDAVFAFRAPEGARRVPFVLPPRAPAPTSGEGAK
jgi:hypothetical protein